MSGFNRGGGGSDGDGRVGSRADFLTSKHEIGGQEFSIAGILIIGGVLIALFGTSSLIGFFSGVGLQILFALIILVIVNRLAQLGLLGGLVRIAMYVVLVAIVTPIIMTTLPRWALGLQTSEWENVWSGVTNGSGRALPGVEQDVGGGYSGAYVGGGITDYEHSPQPQPQQMQPVAPTYGGGTAETPIVDPQQARIVTLQMELLRAVDNGDRAAVEVLVGEIVAIDPNNSIARSANERLATARTMVQNAQRIQGPTGSFGASLNAAEVADVKRVLSGGSYLVISDGAKFFTISDCNEESLLEFTAPPLARGETFTAKRCVIHAIAGNSDTGMTFTVR